MRALVVLLLVLTGCVDPPLEGGGPLVRLRRRLRRRPPTPAVVMSSTPSLPMSPRVEPAPEPVPVPPQEDPEPEPDPGTDADAGAPEPEEEDAEGHKDTETSCPANMVMIHGNQCVTPQQDCLDWMDSELPLEARKRCAKFAPSRCLGSRRHLRFCIDRLEHAPKPDDLPTSDLSWLTARSTCQAEGKRLCYEHEWTFACEGPDALPYPYGLERDANRCNHDRTDLVDPDHPKKMKDNRHKASDHATCLSPFGVQNMVGNVDEWVQLDVGYPPMRSGLKGGWWLAGRNRCRATTGGHDEYYHDIQAGFRCCKDAQ